MANATSKEQMEFVYAMAKHSKATLQDIRRLLLLGSKHRAIQLAKRNRGAYTLITKRLEQNELRIQAGIIAIANSFDASVEFSVDPRECMVKIVVPPYGSTICVPTA